MAIEATDPFALNIEGVTDLVLSGTNKRPSGVPNTDEGADSEHYDVLTLDLSDEELLRLRDQWEDKYAPYEVKINSKQKANKQAYLGLLQQGYADATTDGKPIASNLIFEAEETFIPAALAKNPEPVVYSDNTPEGNKVATDVKTMLQYHADQLVLRRKLATMVRQWTIYYLGVIKYAWNKEINDVSIQNRKIQDFIFDKDGYVDSYGDFVGYLGERITVTADKLVELFPKHKAYITVMVDAKMGTDCIYTEWWTDEYTFCTFKDVVLDKSKNPNFKYDKETTDEFGLPTTEEGRNHFALPKKPYTFLSVFSLQEQPHDITGLIEQNIPNQNLVTRRTYQIDYNFSKANNSDVFSEDNFNQETAKQAAGALAKGNPVLVPAGRPLAEAINRLQAPSLSDAFFKEQEVNKEALRSSFGTQGITSQPPNEDTTARGMILSQQFDNTRIGGGIGDAIEQVADNAFNWLVQLYYVFYDEQHFAAVMGKMQATEYVVLSSQNLDRQLIISVSPDSMKPKDELTQMNQAMELFQAKAIGPVTLLTILNFPDPKESAQDGVLYNVDPMAYMQLNFPEMAQQLQQMQQEAQQAQAQQQQQELAMQGAQGQQQIAQKGASGQQALQQKEASHQQKLRHGEEQHKAKLAQIPPAKPPSLATDRASASLKQVKLPK